eukprot:GFYU01024209.1.p1 GENE.GFYU01024209.1~~GFYU01024209.1.p1  ORF type:complete len:783 (-),score=174.95 GFYU01024209.1:24-2249(-)
MLCATQWYAAVWAVLLHLSLATAFKSSEHLDIGNWAGQKAFEEFCVGRSGDAVPPICLPNPVLSKSPDVRAQINEINNAVGADESRQKMFEQNIKLRSWHRWQSTRGRQVFLDGTDVAAMLNSDDRNAQRNANMFLAQADPRISYGEAVAWMGDAYGPGQEDELVGCGGTERESTAERTRRVQRNIGHVVNLLHNAMPFKEKGDDSDDSIAHLRLWYKEEQKAIYDCLTSDNEWEVRSPSRCIGKLNPVRMMRLPHSFAILPFNYDHFHRCAVNSYEAAHHLAVRRAYKSGKFARNRNYHAARDEFKIALLMNSWADHALSDMFAPGHTRTPSYDLWKKSGCYQKFAGLSTNAAHDEDNDNGVCVKSGRGDVWMAYGDARFYDKNNSENRHRVREAVKKSLFQVYRAFDLGAQNASLDPIIATINDALLDAPSLNDSPSAAEQDTICKRRNTCPYALLDPQDGKLKKRESENVIYSEKRGSECTYKPWDSCKKVKPVFDIQDHEGAAYKIVTNAMHHLGTAAAKPLAYAVKYKLWRAIDYVENKVALDMEFDFTDDFVEPRQDTTRPEEAVPDAGGDDGDVDGGNELVPDAPDVATTPETVPVGDVVAFNGEIMQPYDGEVPDGDAKPLYEELVLVPDEFDPDWKDVTDVAYHIDDREAEARRIRENIKITDRHELGFKDVTDIAHHIDDREAERRRVRKNIKRTPAAFDDSAWVDATNLAGAVEKQFVRAKSTLRGKRKP